VPGSVNEDNRARSVPPLRRPGIHSQCRGSWYANTPRSELSSLRP
jgi:hypothetical protein